MSERIQIAPEAALNEAMALNEFYRNRSLVLAQEIQRLNGELQIAVTGLAEVREELAKFAPPEAPKPGGKAN
ncbi:hypothetical protein [Phyllobacterium sp. P5_D12]